jgi:2-dehydropantoate 2-reductase
MSRSIAVVGIGAIGGAVAADLFERGHRLTLCSRTPFAELVVERPGATTTVPIAAHVEPSKVESLSGKPPDWLLLCTKAHASASARAWLDALCGARTHIAVLQNGVDHVERIRPLLPSVVEDEAALLPVVIQLPAEKVAPGVVHQSRNGNLIVPAGPVGEAFATLFDGGRTTVAPRDDYFTQSWWKLLSNAAIGGVCALALRPNRAAAAPGIRDATLALMREVVLVGRAEGADLPDDAPEKVLERILAAAPDHWSSISVDRREGRPMEWRARNEVVCRLGRAHGVATPLNDLLVALLRAADPGAEAA